MERENWTADQAAAGMIGGMHGSPAGDMGAQSVLIIDDSEDIIALVEAVLTSERIRLASAIDGIAGLEAAGQIDPDLILLDVDMPDPDGFEVCRRLKASQTLREIPVIFLTGASSPIERLRGLELGAIDYVTKPFDAAELRARVHAALRTKHLMDLLEEKAQVLRESEERFRLMAEDSLDLISRYSSDGTCLYASPAAETMLGIRGEELVGRKLSEMLHPEDVERVMGRDASSPTGPVMVREGTGVMFRMRARDGSFKWMEASIRAARGARDFQISCRDVSRRKRAEELEQDRMRVLEMVALGRPLADMMAYVSSMMERQQPGTAACVLALSEGHMRVAAPSMPGEMAEAIRTHALQLAVAVCSNAATAGQMSFMSDLLEDERWAPLRSGSAKFGYRTCVSRLIQSASLGVVGMVSLYARSGQPFDRDVYTLLDAASSLVAMAAEHRQLTERLAYQAQHDALTGLPNRMLFEDRLEQALAQAQRRREHVALMILDVDRFKLVNDTLGHQAGDDLLRQFARRVQDVLRAGETLARLGGDEFGLILPGLVRPEEAMEAAERIRASVDSKFALVDREIVATTSIGISFFPADAPNAKTMQSHADLALYRVKAMGRNGVLAYSAGMDAGQSRRIEIESRLRTAIDRSELCLHYQPQVDRHGNLIGLEALLRWNNPALGNVSPADFIAIAEDSGLIVPIGEWVLREACRQGQEWRERGFTAPRIAINISALQFVQADFDQKVMEILRETKFDPHRVELEVTESSVMRDVHDAAMKLRRISELGVTIAIDDFGTGHSSLAYLEKLPIHRLKIDRSFVRSLDAAALATPSRTAIIRAVMSLGQSLSLEVIAEGVETREQFHFLCGIGCDLMQGYLFAPPQCVEKVERFMAMGDAPRVSLLPEPMAAAG